MSHYTVPENCELKGIYEGKTQLEALPLLKKAIKRRRDAGRSVARVILSLELFKAFCRVENKTHLSEDQFADWLGDELDAALVIIEDPTMKKISNDKIWFLNKDNGEEGHVVFTQVLDPSATIN